MTTPKKPETWEEIVSTMNLVEQAEFKKSNPKLYAKLKAEAIEKNKQAATVQVYKCKAKNLLF